MTRLERHTVELSGEDDITGWREAARALDAAEVRPESIVWRVRGGDVDLFGDAASPVPEMTGTPRRIGRRLLDLIESALLHSDSERFALAYRAVWRTRAEPDLVRIASDNDVVRLNTLSKAVHRDMHKMKAFLRFREVTGPDGGEHFVAWFEPDHHITRATAPFFTRRFANMRWSILTPEASAHWDGKSLRFAGGAAKADAPDGDALEAHWRRYYASIFNPARLKVKAMTAEMPKKYWKNLPEADLIAPLIRDAHARSGSMIEAAPTPRRAIAASRSPLPSTSGDHQSQTLPDLAVRLDACTRCPLHCHATQAVPGEGPAGAALMIVGEQPGDQEDLAGRPFVGPAGQLLDKALIRAGIDRETAYVTNAVKHFKFEPRGKRRIHKRPETPEIEHCRWWLEQERSIVKPRLVLALGATAARALTGRPQTIFRVRGQVRTLDDGTGLLVTVHPSYLLRLQDERRKREEWQAFLADLRTVQRVVGSASVRQAG